MPRHHCWRCKKKKNLSHVGLKILMPIGLFLRTVEIPNPICKDCLESFRRWVRKELI